MNPRRWAKGYLLYCWARLTGSWCRRVAMVRAWGRRMALLLLRVSILRWELMITGRDIVSISRAICSRCSWREGDLGALERGMSYSNIEAKS